MYLAAPGIPGSERNRCMRGSHNQALTPNTTSYRVPIEEVKERTWYQQTLLDSFPNFRVCLVKRPPPVTLLYMLKRNNLLSPISGLAELDTRLSSSIEQRVLLRLVSY